MRRIIEALAFMMIVLSSGTFIQQIIDGGAREQGLENAVKYVGLLNKLPIIWVIAVLFVISILLLSKNLKKIPFSWPMLALIAFCFASTTWAAFPTVAFRSSLLIATAYLLINTQIALYGDRRTVHFFSLALFSILICSLITVIFIPSYGISVGFEHMGRWQGVFSHKNGLGNFAAISFLIYAWQYQQQRSIFAFIASLLALVLIIGSQSSTALVNAAVILCIFTLLRFQFTTSIFYRLRYKIILAVIVLSFFAVFVALSFQEFSIFEKDSSFSGRNMIWSYILAKFAASPWFGYGLEQLGALTNKNSSEFFTNVGFLVGTAHNGFLETVFSLGAIGLLLMLSVFVNLLTKNVTVTVFKLQFSYLIAFILMNTFESKMINFNFFLIGLMYVVAITDVQTIHRATNERRNVKWGKFTTT